MEVGGGGEKRREGGREGGEEVRRRGEREAETRVLSVALCSHLAVMVYVAWDSSWPVIIIIICTHKHKHTLIIQYFNLN